jgi:adenylate cyclase
MSGDPFDFPVPDNEAERVIALESYNLIGTPTEPAFDDLAELAAQFCGCCMGYVTLMTATHESLRGQHGYPDIPEWFEPWPRAYSCCAFTICQSDLVVIPDLKDSPFAGYPSVNDDPYLRFYASMPLINPEGYALGTLCVVDTEPRELSPDHREFMRLLGRQTVAQLELRRKVVQLARSHDDLAAEKMRSDALLSNILPASVAEELKRERRVAPRYFESVTIGFVDFKGFTSRAEHMEPRRLLDDLDFYFSAFDEIMSRHRLEKLKTIGDAYMFVGGLPEENRTHPVDACLAALAIQEVMTTTNRRRERMNQAPWEVRIGIHTGGVMAGVVGRKKFAYDIWGDAVNVAARMETAGEAGRVNISARTHAHVKDRFGTEHRGSIEVKNRGCLDMYFLSAC